jgi:hypothetical protein
MEVSWIADNDITLLNYKHAPWRQTSLLRAAYLWSYHGYSTNVHGIKRLVISIYGLSTLQQLDQDESNLPDLEIVYVLLSKKHDETWEEKKKKCFVDWYLASLRRRREGLRKKDHGFDVKVAKVFLYKLLNMEYFYKDAESIEANKEFVSDDLSMCPIA